ncbi:uncharacterized protein PV07_08612 [Cladophialophora immunda]|uniref:Uncharacterized protein n=1 Tax=Cladophialophora immunda TaxID=569365 RepID=A0A0D2CPE8_9EURO|nr:uncharacterized protein PV07_08612 [Cladophialophora immunda]KIW25439.1 hypothetical protein PV07_08612 [Cladophialophora immunda]
MACFHTKTLEVSEIWALNQITDPGSKSQRKEEKQERMGLDRLKSAQAIASGMSRIAEKQKSGGYRYTTKPRLFQSLLNKLGFVHDGLTFWKGQFKPNDNCVVSKTATKNLENSLEELKKQIHAIDMHFHLGEKKMGRSRRFGNMASASVGVSVHGKPSKRSRKFELGLPEKEGRSATGLPATIAVYADGERVIFGECKSRWYPFRVMDNNFKDMRLDRLGRPGGRSQNEDHYKEVEAKTQGLDALVVAEGGNDADIEALVHRLDSQQGKNADFMALVHKGKLRAYSLCYGEAEKSFKACNPCRKCFVLYRWGDQQDKKPGQKSNSALNCAEDDIHLQEKHLGKCRCDEAQQVDPPTTVSSA